MSTFLLIAAVVLALVIGLFAFHAAAAPAPAAQLPDTTAGRRVAAFLAAFNSGQDEQLRQVLAGQFDPQALQTMPLETRLHTLKQLLAETGKLELLTVGAVNDRELTVVAKGSRRGTRLDLTFLFAPGEEHRLMGARIRQIEDDSEGQAPEIAGGPLSTDGARQAIEADLLRLVKEDKFSGAVLVLRKGATLFQHAYGFADRERRQANDLDTKFNLGSINKVFTKLAIAQLAESGKLALGEPFGRYLPDYPDPEVGKKVTVEQLAAHTSGLGDIFTDRFPALRQGLTSLNAYLALFARKPLEFEPGTRSSYSNAGYVVLGLVVERLSGTDYYSYVRQHIFAPVQMKDTDSYPLAEATPNRAIGYTFGDEDGPRQGQRHPNRAALPARGSSAGGGYSTLADLARFAQALAASQLASAAWTHWVAGGPVPKAGAPAAALPPINLGVAGGSPGVNAVLELDPDQGTVVVLSNYDPPSAQQVSRRIRTLLGRIQG
jgi:D-alanyl-D-alanine carboxypeptidase